ncbi:golgi-body localization protein domain-containing protein [Infundibulicybe gibba]|nr:golgi-body localization protein domain-containing protein [Infundibulicybe gibba]
MAALLSELVVFPVTVSRMLLLDTLHHSWWSSLLIWITRIVTISLLLRTYIAPWILASVSSHIRIRSISLWSIRGLYIRKGSKTWHVERVSYVFYHVGHSRRLTVKIHGLTLEVGKDETKYEEYHPRRHNRRPTLADFSPYPVAHRLWRLLGKVHTWLEPTFRPFVRTAVVASLRIIIRWLPLVTQAVTFEITSSAVNFAELPGTSVSAQSIRLHTALTFTELEHITTYPPISITTTKSSSMYNVSTWRKRLAGSFQRALDRAWGTARGTATLALDFHDVAAGPPDVKFVGFPADIAFSASVAFNPREGTIDTHSVEMSLNLGDCFLKLDALLLFLDRLKTARPPKLPPLIDCSISSPTPFTTSPLEVSPVGFPDEQSKMVHPTYSSAGEPSLSPKSPIFEAISASIRTRSTSYQPCARLKQTKNSSWLSILKSATIQIPRVTISRQSSYDMLPYECSIQNVGARVCLSSPSDSPLHQEWLGHVDNDGLTPDAYGIHLSMESFTLKRAAHHSTSLLVMLGPVRIQALVSQWPSPWLESSSFIRGDANSSLIAVRISLSGLGFTEQLGHLRHLLNGASKRETSTIRAHPRPPFPVPRLAFQLECGKVCGRITPELDSSASAVELRTDGFVVSLASNFSNDSYTVARRRLMSHADHIPLRMDITFDVALKPTFIRMKANWTTGDCASFWETGSSDGFLEHPPLLSMEALELSGDGHALADIQDYGPSPALVDPSSLIFDLHCSTDAICIELWHPVVVTEVFRMISALRIQTSVIPSTPMSHEATSQRLLDKLPCGLSVTAAVGRLVLFITAPDINPDDTMDLSRGFAVRSGIMIQYCSMGPVHAHRFKRLGHRSQTRHKLYLPEERIVESVAAAKASTISQIASAFLRISVSNLGVRSAVATQYVPDDPLVAEGDNPAFSRRDFLRIRSIRLNIRLSGRRGSKPPEKDDICHISGHVPHITGSFTLAHAYHILLALRTIQSLIRVHQPNRVDKPTSSGTIYQHNLTITTVQVIWALLDRKLVTRIDEININATPAGPLRFHFDKFYGWVPLYHNANHQDNSAEEWEELINLQLVDLSISNPPTAISISLQADSARLRIPFGYILADLIQDTIVTLKALRHIARTTAIGRCTGIPNPEPEGPKAIPEMTFAIRCVCLEASDDPFESQLSIIIRAGAEAARQRIAREIAFDAKAAVVLADLTDGQFVVPTELDLGYNFDAAHSISIAEARERLEEVHAVDWRLRHRQLVQVVARSQEAILRQLTIAPTTTAAASIPNLVRVSSIDPAPPLFRAMLLGLSLTISPASFPADSLPDFLHHHGHGLPRDTQFSLLIPMHIRFTLSSLKVTLRDYPLPLFNVPPNKDAQAVAWEFDTDLVIGEEMGTDASVDWIECPILQPHKDIYGSAPLSVLVPKTIMPVKSYANPEIHITTTEATSLSWGVSYSAATQDLMRIVETLSSSPRDSSPAVGFWDKMRLAFHWTIRASFKGEVHYYMKGARDPHSILDAGAGFVLAWQGAPQLLINHKNEDNELIQVKSDSMLVAIPDLQNAVKANNSKSPSHKSPFRKICAQLRSGVRFGIGFVGERSCGTECNKCIGNAFERKCRYFSFRPHYDVKFEKKSRIPMIKSPEDSFNGFRSDFIHLSISLASSTNPTSRSNPQPSSFHLTPKSFTHFWSWWALFEGVLSLPIRQGTYFPPRPVSPKLGRHLATLKYRITIPRVFVMHAYVDDSRETWADGLTPWIGVKGMIDEFQADMHQRDQESVVPGLVPNAPKVTRRKPFYAAELVLKGVDLRALLAIFSEPLKKDVPISFPSQRSNYRTRNDLPSTDLASPWYDTDDFVETDWTMPSPQMFHLLPVANIPHFTYFKRNLANFHDEGGSSKFGNEESHTCLLGREPSVPQIQISLASARMAELSEAIRNSQTEMEQSSLGKMAALLQEYITLLQRTEPTPKSKNRYTQNYHIPSDTVSPSEWAEFDHVYQIHCPKIFMDSAIRDIMIQYYLCSRARKGLEYHMATRAIKFICDQADTALEVETEHNTEKNRTRASTAQNAASALRKMLKGEYTRSSVEVSQDVLTQPPGPIDPLNGWSDGVSLQKSHCCLLLKPQIVLRGEKPTDTCVVAAVQAKLQAFAIMDNANRDDPISGKVMSRSYTSLFGLQTFSPTKSAPPGVDCVPLEVLIDLRCESTEFDRIVPQTDATFHYDKFNRLRLSNNATSVVSRGSSDRSAGHNKHLQDQTDLIQVNIPRFTVAAADTHKTRLDRLETLLFKYDFNDLRSAAGVISELQGRLRDAIETDRIATIRYRQAGDQDKLDLLTLKAHIYLLAEELDFVFDAIKLAQDRSDDRTDQKSALMLRTSSSEISWKMLDDGRELLSKLVVQNISFQWLNRQDSSTVNNLTVGNLQAFDGSQHALWTEILTKHDEATNHPLSKRGLFLLANWTVLAPVGGITIYEEFELQLHPMRLQIDAKVGRRIMEYVWPARKNRQSIIADEPAEFQSVSQSLQVVTSNIITSRASLDSPRSRQTQPSSDRSAGLAPPLRRLGTSRSFTDLRSTQESSTPRPLSRTQSSEALRQFSAPPITPAKSRTDSGGKGSMLNRSMGDAAEMKTRSSQKTFVLVRISSLNLVLSILKEGSFECRDARIRTRELEYRNQTSSFEELVDHFIPSDMSWRGWVKMAFQQPLVPVIPVARELISKTKWIAPSKGDNFSSKLEPPNIDTRPSDSPQRKWRRNTKPSNEAPSTALTPVPTTKPEHLETPSQQPNGRRRVISLFHRSASKKDQTMNSPRHSEERPRTRPRYSIDQ